MLLKDIPWLLLSHTSCAAHAAAKKSKLQPTAARAWTKGHTLLRHWHCCLALPPLRTSCHVPKCPSLHARTATCRALQHNALC
jgi:hypothetical protein